MPLACLAPKDNRYVSLGNQPTLVGAHKFGVVVMDPMRPLEGNWTVAILNFDAWLVVVRVVRYRDRVIFIDHVDDSIGDNVADSALGQATDKTLHDLFSALQVHAQRLPILLIFCQTTRMRRLTVTLCLTIAILLGSVGISWSADYQKGLTTAQSGDFAIGKLLDQYGEQSELPLLDGQS
jgi:hypothetical protein